jgi:hypothetical protein
VTWLFVAIAMSPTLVDLGSHWLASAWARYSLIHGLLLMSCLCRGPREEPRVGLGYGLIAAGVGVQLLALLASVAQVARPGLVLALAGVILATGASGWRAAVLSLWVVPLPRFVAAAMGGDQVVVWLCSWVGGALVDPGTELIVTVYSMRTPEVQLALVPGYGGPIAIMSLLGLAWYVTTRCQLDVRRMALLGAVFGVLAMLLQLGFVVLSAVALVAGWPRVASFTIAWGATLVGVAIALPMAQRFSRSNTPR